MRPLAALALALPLLAAGCSGPGPGEAAVPTAGPSSPGAPAANGTAPDARAVAVNASFGWSGHTKEGAWVCSQQSGLGPCAAGQQVAPDGAHVRVLPYSGNLTGAELTMTWQADPTQTGLVLAVYGNTSAGRGLVAAVQGDSPLDMGLGLADAGLLPDHALVLAVWPEGKTPTSPSLFVDATRQPFTVQGTLRSERPA
jgi:hypothetical protein